jgi:hypothetical protein
MSRMKVGAIVVALWGGSSAAWAWSTAAHQEVTIEAINASPGGLKDFYKKHRLEMPGLSPEARSTDHGQERRFAIDRLLPFPFRDLPRTEPELVTKFGEEAKTIGRLPWLIHESYDRVVAAFKGGDKAAILKESDTLSDLIADLHNPLALSDNADGQKAGQQGLWVRFTDRFPSRVHSLSLKAGGAHLIDDPTGYLHSIISSSYVWLDNILYADDLAHRQDPAYGGVYYENLDERAGHILNERLGWAARDVASYWYTAWTAAGRPEMK